MLGEQLVVTVPMQRPAVTTFDTMLGAFLDNPRADPVDTGAIRLLARSPDSLIAAALWARLPEIAGAGAQIRTALLEWPRTSAAAKAQADFERYFDGDGLRVLTNPSLGDMFEQATLGGYAHWLGAPLNQEGAPPDGGMLELIRNSEAAGQRASVARLNFSICWRNARALVPA